MSYKKQANEILYLDISDNIKRSKLERLKNEIKADYKQSKADVGKGFTSVIADVHASQTRQKTKRNKALSEKKRRLEDEKKKLISFCDQNIQRIPEVQKEIFQRKKGEDISWARSFVLLLYAIARLDGLSKEEMNALKSTLEKNQKKLQVLDLAELNIVAKSAIRITSFEEELESSEEEKLYKLSAIILNEAKSLRKRYDDDILKVALKDISDIIQADKIVSPAEEVVSSFLERFWFDVGVFSTKQKEIKIEYKLLLDAERKVRKYSNADESNPKAIAELHKYKAVVDKFNPKDKDLRIQKAVERALYIASQYSTESGSNVGAIWSKALRFTAKVFAVLFVLMGVAFIFAPERFWTGLFFLCLGFAFMTSFSIWTEKVLGKRVGVGGRVIFVICALIFSIAMS